MHWPSWQAFWAMGGSGDFVWSAYGVVGLSLAAEILLLRARIRRARWRQSANVKPVSARKRRDSVRADSVPKERPGRQVERPALDPDRA